MRATELRRKRIDLIDYIEDAHNFISSNVNMKVIKKLGLERDPLDYGFSCCYPPFSALQNKKDFSFINENISSPISLYLHVPFCDQKCSYCYFTSSANLDKEIQSRYLKALINQITEISKHLNNKLINAIYFGGGTPTIIDQTLFEKIFVAIHKNFTLKNDAEIAVESTPNRATKEYLNHLYSWGVNRISIGVQSFNDDILKLINRTHNSNEADISIENALNIGFKNINIDLIPGFPKLINSNFLESVFHAIKLGVPCITFYQLETRRPIPIIKKYPSSLPSFHENLIEQIAFRNLLKDSHYDEYLVCWFRNTQEAKYLQQEHKWNDGNFLGVGVSSYGYLNGYMYYSENSILNYIRAIENGEILPILRVKKLSSNEILKRLFYFGLRLPNGLQLDNNENKIFYSNDLAEFRSRINLLLNHKLIAKKKNRYQLSQIGRFFSDEISEFFTPEIKWKRNNKKYPKINDEIVNRI